MVAGHSYNRIIKASSVLGASTGLVLIFSLSRTKFAAVVLGTNGVGTLVSLTAFISIFTVLTGAGLVLSGVREISNTKLEEQQQVIQRLHRLNWIFGLLGMLVAMSLSPLFSYLLFQSLDHVVEIAILGIAVLLSNLTSTFIAVMQGQHRNFDFAKASVGGAVTGTLFAIYFFWQFGETGIAPGLLAISFFRFIFAKYFAKQAVNTPRPKEWLDTVRNSFSLIRVGASYMWSELLSILSVFFVIVFLSNTENIQTVGIFSAALTLATTLYGFFLSSMATDLYPQLVKLRKDHLAVIGLVNHQTQVVLLFAFPVLLFVIYFADQTITILYSKEFNESAVLLRILMIGVLARFVAFPLNYISLATGNLRNFLSIETATFSLLVLLATSSYFILGITGIALAFVLTYVVQILILVILTKKTVGFKPTKLTVFMAAIAFFTGTISTFVSQSINTSANYFIGALIVTLFVLISAYVYYRVMGNIFMRRKNLKKRTIN